jgi:hypothetical protein
MIRRRTRGARRVPIAAGRADDMATTAAGALVVSVASTAVAKMADVSSATDAASPNRRQDRKIGTANTPFSKTIVDILAEKPYRAIT